MSVAVAVAVVELATAALVAIWVWERLERVAGVERSLRILHPKLAPRRGKNLPVKESLTAAELGALCQEVVARLQAGSPAEQAWLRSIERLVGVQMDEMGVAPLLENSGDTGATVLIGVRFSAATGAPLAEVLERVSDSITESQKVKEAAKIAFAGPKASARVLSALPVVGLLGAGVLGASPIQWFLSGPMQGLLAIVGISLAVFGNSVSRRMIHSALARHGEDELAPVLCDLAVAGLRSGQPVPSVLRSLGEAVDNPSFGQIGRELELGATWSEAWLPVPPSGDLLHTGLEPAWSEGISPVAMLNSAAKSSRMMSSSRARQAAEKLSVKLAFPLGLLLLPSFVILGLVPLFFSLVGTELSNLLG